MIDKKHNFFPLSRHCFLTVYLIKYNVSIETVNDLQSVRR